MIKNISHYLKQFIIPLFLAPTTVGAFVGLSVFVFKFLCSFVVNLSSALFSIIQSNVILIIPVLIFAIVFALISALIAKHFPKVKGGGIPFALILSHTKMKLNYIKNIIAVILSSLITFFVGVPLGNEGPSVQIGALIGDGIGKALKRDDYNLTACGAGAGFSAVTGTFLSGIIFSVEEMHIKPKPRFLILSFISSIMAFAVNLPLCKLFNISYRLFDIGINTTFDWKYIYISVIVGIICGFSAILFTYLYKLCRLINQKVKLPYSLKVMIIFLFSVLLLFIAEDIGGPGHALVEKLLHTRAPLFLLLIILISRAVILLTANNVGVTGGLFLPLIALGALIGAVVAEILIATGILPISDYMLPVLIGAVAFISAVNHMPLTMFCLSAEGICSISGAIYILPAIVISYIIFRLLKAEDLTHTVIKNHIKE